MSLIELKMILWRLFWLMPKQTAIKLLRNATADVIHQNGLRKNTILIFQKWTWMIYTISPTMEYEKKLRHDKYIELLASRGLPFIQKLLTVNEKDCRNIVVSNMSRSGPFLKEDFTKTWVPGGTAYSKAGSSRNHIDDSLVKPNAGWLWATNIKWATAECSKLCNFGLRDGSYVFWDRDRLTSLDLPDKARELEGSECDTFPEYRCRSTVPSAEERLRGIKVPREVLLELAPKDHCRDADHDLVHLFGDPMY